MIPLAAAIFSDLIMALTPLDGCYVLSIDNALSGVLVTESHIVTNDALAVTVQVTHRLEGDRAEEITVLAPPGWWADRESLVLADNDSTQVFICPEVGA